VRIARKPIFELACEDIELIGYQHHPFIRFEVAV
jgi:thymidylate synthase